MSDRAGAREGLSNRQRERLARQKLQLIESWESGRAIQNKAVIEAFKKVRREFFVLPEYENQAYADAPLPILAGQTISQPSTVVLMLDALEVKPGQKILEIGTGSGYNAALLGVMVGNSGKVITTEIIPELAEFAINNLKKAGITNVNVIKADGSKGYQKEAPYDRIICTAAAPKIPPVLTSQLKEGGIMLIPVGAGYLQRMVRARKIMGVLETEDLGDYVFVPLVGEFGQ